MKICALWLWILLFGITLQAQAFQAEVSNVYYGDGVRTVSNYDFSDGTKTGDIITIPGSFVTKPSPAEDVLSYTFGLYPGTDNMTFSWTSPNPGVLEVAAGNANGVAVISTTPSLPDASSAQTAYTYTAKLQNFADMTDAGKSYIASVGLGSEVAGNAAQIVATWKSDGQLSIQARIGEDSPVWSSGLVTQTGLTPAATTLEIKLENTGSAINFYYNLNAAGWTLLGTFGSGEGYVADNFKGFPELFPFVTLGVEDNFKVPSFHWGTDYFVQISVQDPDGIYDSVSVVSSGAACGDSVPLTALTYVFGRWFLQSPMNVSITTSGVKPSCYPEYTFTAVKKAGGTDTVTRTVTGYVEDFPTSLQPTGNVGGNPTFAWSGVKGATGYYVMSGNNMWGQWVNAPVTRLDYTGPALTSGNNQYLINANVETNGQTNTSMAMGAFTYDTSATYSYTFRVKDSAANPLEGVAVEMLGNADVNTTTDASGNFIIGGLPFGSAVSLKLSKTGYVPTYSNDMYNLSSQNILNLTGYKPLYYTLYSPEAIASWGVVSGSGVINGRVIDQNSMANLSGAVVTYTSAQKRTYQVKYVNESGTLVDGPSTFANGIFMIINVADGDTVIASATKAGYNIAPRIYRTHADAVTQSSLFGTPRVFSRHYYNGSTHFYFMNTNFSDLGDEIASLTLSGPNVGSPVSLTYNAFNRIWNISQFLGTSVPNLSTPYTLSLTYKAGGETTEDHAVSGFVGLPSNISPAAGSAVYGNPTFSWTGSAANYNLHLQNGSSKLTWSNLMLTSTSVTYDGFIPLNGSYTFFVESYDAAGNYSQYAVPMTCYQTSVFASFSNSGIWQYSSGSWLQVTSNNPQLMAASGSILYAAFEGAGIWKYDGAEWSQITSNDPEKLIVYNSKVYATFAGTGIWLYESESWSQMTANNPHLMAVSPSGILVASFENAGLWYYLSGTWTQFSTNNPQQMVMSSAAMYGAFADGGIWKYSSSVWSQVTTNDPGLMSARTSSAHLYGTFAGGGLWKYDGSDWTQATANSPRRMEVTASGLYGVFTGTGIWYYNGADWSQITGNDPLDMVVGN